MLLTFIKKIVLQFSENIGNGNIDLNLVHYPDNLNLKGKITSLNTIS